MAYTTKPVAVTLFQMSVALAFFLAICMARNIANYDLATVDLAIPTELTSPEIPRMPSMPSSQKPEDPEPNATGCTKSYNVKKGETCYSTWTRFKVEEKTFNALNTGIDCDNLDIDQALCIAGDTGGDLPKPDEPALAVLPELPALPPSTEPADSEPNTSGCSKTYKVKKGETCYSTWTRFKVKEKTFYTLNPDVDCDNLDIGQALCIAGDAEGDLPKPDESALPVLPELPALPPSTEPTDSEPNTSGCSKTYKVKKGETCYSTWTRFKVKEKTFYTLNPDVDCDNLDIGQALCIVGDAEGDLPKPDEPAALPVLPELPALPPSTEPADSEPNTSGCSKTYKVKKGETCYSTWMRFKVKEKTFYTLNPDVDCDNLDIAQALCIAGDEEASSDLPKSSEPVFPELPALPPSTEPAGSEPNTSECSKTYKVKKGETCYSTWTKFKVKEKTFYALNPGIDCDNLDIGQALCIARGAN